MTRVLVTPRSLTRAGLDAVPELEPLRERGVELVSGPAGATPTPDQLAVLLEGCEGWIAGVEPISDATLAGAPALRVISRNGTGLDAIDLAAAERLGVAVLAARGANAQGVAELALALALAALRQVPWSAADLREGRWSRQPARELAELTVGVVGLGAIGARVAQAFTALGAAVVGHDPVAPAGEVARLDLPGLVDVSDVVTLHAPPTPGRTARRRRPPRPGPPGRGAGEHRPRVARRRRRRARRPGERGPVGVRGRRLRRPSPRNPPRCCATRARSPPRTSARSPRRASAGRPARP